MLELIRKDDLWLVYTVGEGKRTLINDYVIPPQLTEDEAIVFLEDLFHEAASPSNPKIKILK